MHGVRGQVPLQLVLPNAWLAVLLIIPIALVVVNLLAIWPARRAARGMPASALRSE
jgi:ABC-type lipoprotein release transport system permease subunit